MDPIQTTADPVDPEEAVNFFRSKVVLTDEQFDEIAKGNHRKAFTLAGVADIDVVQDVYDSLDTALASGIDFRDWKATIGEKLESAWGGTVANPGFRLETIFRTNCQGAYMAGRYQQARADTDDRPYWMLDVVEDDATSDICGDLDDEIGGKAIDADDPVWLTAYPPNHFRCRSQVITLTEDQAREMGILDDPPEVEVEEGFDGPPDSYEPDASEYDDDLAGDVERFADGE